MSSKNYGITLRLNAVLVEELKEYTGGGSTAEDFGFEVAQKPDTDFDEEAVEW